MEIKQRLRNTVAVLAEIRRPIARRVAGRINQEPQTGRNRALVPAKVKLAGSNLALRIAAPRGAQGTGALREAAGIVSGIKKYRPAPVAPRAARSVVLRVDRAGARRERAVSGVPRVCRHAAAAQAVVAAAEGGGKQP
jgi:hypothetical protein